MRITFISILTVLFFTVLSCGHQTDVVESGTYDGTIQKVKPEEKEIYVKTENGKTLELYFIEETKLTENGNSVEFKALESGQKVSVKVKKVGKRLDPLSVKIID